MTLPASLRSALAEVVGPAVLAGGAVVSHLAGLAKDNTGYDLAGLLTGSEGTLGVITRLRLRLVPRPPARTVALLAFPDPAAALAAVAAVRRWLSTLEAAELGGSISAEHGIGVAKRPWLGLNRTDAEITAFRAIKSALDPAGIMNPNVRLP